MHYAGKGQKLDPYYEKSDLTPNYHEGSQIYLPFHGSSKPIYDIHQLQSYYQRHIYYLYFVVNDNPNLNFSGSHI